MYLHMTRSTLFLALLQRLNVYYAAPLAGLCLIEAARIVAGLFGRTARARTALAVLGAVLLALPMAPGIRDEISAVRVPGSDLFQTLEWMRRKLPHAVDAYDPRLLSREPPPELARELPAPQASMSVTRAPERRR